MALPPARFHYGDTVSWFWPGSSVECTGKIVASDEQGITALGEDRREYTVPHGTFYRPGERPDDDLDE
jgi:hypothetical protein